MKKVMYLLILILFMFSCNKGSEINVDKLKNEDDLISQLKISINKEYYNWKIDDNNIINIDKNVKVNFTDSAITIFGLDEYNYQIEETVLMTYVSTSKQTRECFEDLEKIHKKASITKIHKKLEK
jgi:hypothetical protein